MDERKLLAPIIGTGAMMAAYLLLRPYGDMPAGSAQSLDQARAFASPLWVAAHLFGAGAIASFGRFALRLSDGDDAFSARLARWSGLAGVVLVLPYYGAETFALHEIGQAALAGDPGVLALVDPIRNHPAALATFGLGLLLLAVSGVTVALVWHRRHAGMRGWAAWPLGTGMALLLPQFYLPPTGRMVFGVVYAVAGALLAWAMATPSDGVNRVQPRAGRQPADSASPDEQNHRSPRERSMTVSSYQRPPGSW